MADTYRRRVMQCLRALVCSLTLAIAPALAYDWLQFGGNPQHSGNNTAETGLNPGNVSSLMQRYQTTLPAVVDGAPVFLENVTTSAGFKNLLFVTTRDGRIIAIDAQNGATVWSHQYGPGPCQINNIGGACFTTSSPAIDPNRLYVYSYGLDGYVHKYQVGDGTEIITGGWPQITTLKGFDEKGSSALSTATSAGTTYLYVTHGGYPGDSGDYQGHVTAINLATGAQEVFNAACSDQAAHLHTFGGGVAPTCATLQNAIWSRPGVIYDAGTDRIFMGTGNAFNGTPGQFDGNHNWSESVIALHPDGSGGSGGNAGRPLDSYTPTDYVSLDSVDRDVGSTAPAILPVPPSSRVQHLAVQGGKDTTLRLLNLQDLSGRGGPGNVGGEVGSIISVPQGGQVLSQPAVWVNSADGSTWIFVVNGSGASGLRLNFDASGNPSLSTQWRNDLSGTSPVVANGVVFFVGSSSIYALDPVSGTPLWSVARNGSTHWQSLIVANGAVYATDEASHLAAFGLPQNPTQTTLGSSPNPSFVGASVTFTATVAGTAPTGTVVFTADSTAISGCDAVALTGASDTRTAACPTSGLSAGVHSIVASYGGDAGNVASSSAPLSQVVNPSSQINVALASNGGIASASSTYTQSGYSFAAAAINNNERAGVNWGNGGGWIDATANSYPDWVEIDFNGSKTIDHVIVYTLQDNYTSPVEPTDTLTFGLYGVTDFTVQGWNGASWVTLGSVSGNHLVKRTVNFAATTTDRIRINVTNALSSFSRITEVEAWGVNAGPPSQINVALASNGGIASASSTYTQSGYSFAAAAINNNERAGVNWGNGGGWIDATANSYPDWVEIDFNGSKTIDHVVVYTVQDNYTSPVEPTDTLTFGLYGVTDFTVQGWNGASWVTLGTVSGNHLVKRTVNFAATTTDRIRINVTNALASYARITEVEAWGVNAGPLQTNVALASNGGIASASSTYTQSGYSFAAAAINNNERAGVNWGNGGGWIDATANAYPDWVEIDFNGSKTIGHVVVYSVQDNYASPIEPSDSMTFGLYGITDFTVQGWNGASWVTLGTVSGNNLVKRTVNFTATTTDRIRINVTNALSSFSRITEVEAWGN
jgi:Bacterial Ig-like domain (group 3)/PQQ-like domain